MSGVFTRIVETLFFLSHELGQWHDLICSTRTSATEFRSSQSSRNDIGRANYIPRLGFDEPKAGLWRRLGMARWEMALMHKSADRPGTLRSDAPSQRQLST